MNRGAFLAPAMLIAAACAPSANAETAVRAPAAEIASSEKPGLKTALFAGGCFWGVEGVFSHVKGVTSAVSGYHGGDARTATYEMVSGGQTGHAEVVRVKYDPAVVRYDQLLRVFFSVVADPTLVNRQGPDRGTQYRATLIPVSAEQKQVAAAYLQQLGKSGLWKAPIATKIEGYKAFHPAEAYHQDFMKKNPGHGYILRWDAPKVEALKSLYPALYKSAYQPG